MKIVEALASLLCLVVGVPLLASADQTTVLVPGGARQTLQGAQQSNLPPAVQQTGDAIEDAVERFGVGVFGGVGLDPELVEFGAHARFGPLLSPNFMFRPGVEFGLGEVTTMFAINTDVIYTLAGGAGAAWRPYVGAGPTFGMSNRGFEPEDIADADTDEDEVDQPNRFDFSDTDFNPGFNFIAGARNARGAFFEMRATAGGVSNVRLLAGFNF